MKGTPPVTLEEQERCFRSKHVVGVSRKRRNPLLKSSLLAKKLHCILYRSEKPAIQSAGLLSHAKPTIAIIRGPTDL